MQIEIEYSTQVRAASGLARESIEVSDTSTLVDLLKRLLALHPELAPWIEATGQPRPGLLLFVNDQSPAELHQTVLRPNDSVALMTLVSGG